MRIASLLASAALAAACLPAGAQSMKPGLWEIHNKTSNAEADQAMAEMQKQLAQMPPAQRKQMEAMLAQQGVRMGKPGAGGGMVTRSCVTQEMIARNAVPMREGCRITRNERSGNVQKIAFVCTDPPSSGEGQFTFGSPGSYSSAMTVRTTVDGQVQVTSMATSASWVKADCGNVKPAPPPPTK